MRVALFIPCFVDQFFPQVGMSMVKVLRRLNVEVDYPARQTCCGQPAFNTGYWDEARKLAQRYCDVFADAEAIVSPSGSCTAMVRNFYPELLAPGVVAPVQGASRPAAETAATTANWQRVCANTFEFSEFLVRKLGVTDIGAKFPARVTYHDGCHALRELRLKSEPRELLRRVAGLELVEMGEAETCCGFGGTFSVKFPMISYAMDEVKCASIQTTGAQYVVSTDSSCLMQIDGYLRRQKLPVKTIHLAEVLAAT
jgi:L-lactate dehydrogenase complex protein LldE